MFHLESFLPSEIEISWEFSAVSGWEQFFRGRIAKAWRIPIGTFYKIRQPVQPGEWWIIHTGP
jgi:hypothetical protein